MKIIKSIFWNAPERRLRAGWRIVIQLLLFALVLIPLAILTTVLGNTTATAVTSALLYLAWGLAVAWLMARFIDRRPFADYGFHLDRSWWLDLGFGLVLGALLMTGIFLVEYLSGWIRVTSTAEGRFLSRSGQVLVLSLLSFLAIGVNEEFTFRGYQLRNLAEGFAGRHIGPRLAILLALFLSSSLFGFAHMANPNASAISTFSIILAGLLLSLPYVLTGELAVSIGLHVTWNLFQGTVYGFPVSGSAPSTHVLAIEQAGPSLWTGGDFGPEGGLLSVAAVVLGWVFTLLRISWRHKQLAMHLQIARYEGRTAQKKTGDLAMEPGGEPRPCEP
jgi:membrane protease YdiL (CAAX protease family)